MLYLVFYNDLYELIIVFELIMLIVDNLSEKEMIIVILGSCENVIKIIYYQIDLQEYIVYCISVVGVIRKGFIKFNYKIIVVIEEDSEYNQKKMRDYDDVFMGFFMVC